MAECGVLGMLQKEREMLSSWVECLRPWKSRMMDSRVEASPVMRTEVSDEKQGEDNREQF